MRLYNLRPNQKRVGGIYELVAQIGFTTAKGGSDHAGAAALTQTLTLATLKPGDMVLPGTVLDILTPYGHASTLTVSLGITGTVDRFVAASDVKSAANKAYAGTTATHALPYVNQSNADVLLIATYTAGASTVSAVTAGEIRARIPIVRRADRVESLA